MRALDQVRALVVPSEHVADSRHVCPDEVTNETEFLLTSDWEALGNQGNSAIVLCQYKGATPRRRHVRHVTAFGQDGRHLADSLFQILPLHPG